MPDEPAITTQALTRRFGDKVAVDHLDLHVPLRSVYGFLGPNGAGKSTTIRLLLGLLRPTEGTVHLLGQPFQPNRRALLRRIGTLVEMPSLYGHLTGRENLEVARRMQRVPKTDIDRVLGIVRLEADAHRLVRTYSLGMRQRLGIAHALLGAPELLILDEPTNGLDPAGIHEMRALIDGLPEATGATIFVSSHLLSEVELIASHVGIIHEGRLLFEGTLEDLRAQQTRRLTLGVRPVEKALGVLEEAGWQPHRADTGCLYVPAEDEAQAARLTALLVQHGLDVFHVSIEETSLETTFLALTDSSTEKDAA